MVSSSSGFNLDETQESNDTAVTPEWDNFFRNDIPCRSYVRDWVNNLNSQISCDSDMDKMFTGSFNSTAFSDSIGTHPLEKRDSALDQPTSSTKNADQESFFTLYEKSLEEITRRDPKWSRQGDIYFVSDEAESLSSPENRWMDVMSVFKESSQTSGFASFQNHFEVDWNIYDKAKMQYLVWTKVCMNHPDGEFVEMKKEDKRCRDCGGTNMEIEIRVTIPLSMNNVQLPLNEEIMILVATRVSQLPLWKDTSCLTLEKMREMYSCGKRVATGKASVAESKLHKQWISEVKKFVKTQFDRKRYLLDHGRIIRRKVARTDGVIYRKCFIFADVYQFR